MPSTTPAPKARRRDTYGGCPNLAFEATGYFRTENDVVSYGVPRTGLPTWPRVLRNLGSDAPGKRAYVDCLRELYGG